MGPVRPPLAGSDLVHEKHDRWAYVRPLDRRIPHVEEVYVDDGVHTQTIERFFSLVMKRHPGDVPLRIAQVAYEVSVPKRSSARRDFKRSSPCCSALLLEPVPGPFWVCVFLLAIAEPDPLKPNDRPLHPEKDQECVRLGGSRVGDGSAVARVLGRDGLRPRFLERVRQDRILNREEMSIELLLAHAACKDAFAVSTEEILLLELESGAFVTRSHGLVQPPVRYRVRSAPPRTCEPSGTGSRRPPALAPSRGTCGRGQRARRPSNRGTPRPAR